MRKMILVLVLCLVLPGMAGAEEARKLDEVVVTADKEKGAVVQAPEKTTIDIDAYETAGQSAFIEDIIKDQPILDYRGAGDLIPGGVTTRDNTLWMRGFTSYRFATAVDGANVQKTGGRRSYIVNYSLFPSFLFDRVEILPGPHSALYPGKSIGGVVNLVTQTPARAKSAKPQVNVTTGFKSYDTFHSSIDMHGGVDNFIYDLGYQRYATDGYLRNTAVEMDSFFGRVGYILPSDGYIALTVSDTESGRDYPVKNDPSLSDYDAGYPVVSSSSYYGWQDPEFEDSAIQYRLNYRQPTLLGTFDLNAYYGKEDRQMLYLAKDSSGNIYDASWEVNWHQQGGKLTDTVTFGNHTITFGGDVEQCFDGLDYKRSLAYAYDDEKRTEILAGFAQDRWRILPRLTLTTGLRYEHAAARIENFSTSTGALYITGESKWIDRSWDGWLPKSFLTYEMDDLAPSLRDTAVSLGVSRIFRAPTMYGEFNPRARPAGAWLDAEHGVGYDLILSRRLINDIQLKFDYSYYVINDYIAWNFNYAEYTPSSTNSVTPGLEYMDYCINLDKVIRHGIEVQLNGKLTDDLSFYLGYAFQTFDSKGGEPAGETELDDYAENRVNAGLRYQLFDRTRLLLDYKFQDKQTVRKSEEVAEDEWVYTEIDMAAYHLFNFSVEQDLFRAWNGIENARLKFTISNLLDESYENLSGYPATDRTYGVSLSFSI